MKKGREILLTIVILSLLFVWVPKVHGGPATHFQVIVPSTAKIGIPFNITIKALDASGLVDTTYTGTVNFTVNSSYGITLLTGSTTFAVGDAGVKTISNTFNASNLPAWVTVTLTATDSVNPSITGTSSGIQVTGGVPNHFKIDLSSTNILAGESVTFTVTVQDSNNNTVGDYNQTVIFTSTDPQAVFSPSTYTFIPADNGVHTFVNGVTLKTAGNQTITVSDSSISSTSATISVGFSTLHHFNVTASTLTPTAGTVFNITVTAVDEYNNTITNYLGTVHFTTTDSNTNVVLPGDYTFAPGDSGTYTFGGVILCTAGSQTIYVEDTSNPLIKGSLTLNVQPEPLASCSFQFDPIGPQTRGNPFLITIKVVDSFGNVNQSFSGIGFNADLTSSAGTVTPSTVGPFTNGVWSGNITLDTASNTMTITASDPGLTVGNGTSNTFTVSDPDPASFLFDSIPDQSIGSPFQITVKAVDGSGRIVASWSGNVKLFVSTSGGTVTPNIINLTNGIWTGNITLSNADSGVKLYANYYYGEYIYNSANATVDAGDTRLTPVRNYGTNTLVNASDFDAVDALALISFAATEKHAENIVSNGVYDNGEYIYDDVDGDNLVSVGDKRLTYVGNYRYGTVVQSGDSDIGTALISFGATELHTDHVVTNTTYDSLYGESNIFAVSTSAVDHFEFAVVPSPQTAGVPFTVTIYAKDSSGRTVTSFNEQVTLSSSPAMGVSTNPSPVVFVNGVWTGSVTLNTPSTAVKLIASYGSATGESNTFALQGTLNHFSFSYIPSPQKVGQAFYVEITARDGNENIVTNFLGNVNLTLNPSGPVSPSTVGPFVNGKWSGYITVNASFSSVQVIATDAGGSGMTGASNAFSVLGPLDHFHFSSIGPQASGVPFHIRIEAHDMDHNLIYDLDTTLTLTSSVGNIIPGTVTMTNGVFEGDVTIDTPTPDVFITATAEGKSGNSNHFSVSAGLHHFTFDPVASPQTAGTQFFVKIYAKDHLDNVIPSFSATVSLSATVPTNYVIEPTSVTFQNGVWQGYVTLYKSGTNVQLRADFASKYGLSNTFNVIPGPLHHFEVTSNDPDPATGEYRPVGPQTAGCVFNPGAHPENALRVTAVDQWGNTVTTYTGTIHFTSTDGAAVLPADYTFVAGDNGTQTFGSAIIMNTPGIHTITVYDVSNPGVSGTSEPFSVASPVLDHFDFDPIGPQTINNSFNVTIYAKDSNGYIISAYDNNDTWGVMGVATCDTILSASSGNINGGATYTTPTFTLGKITVSVILDTPSPNMKIKAEKPAFSVSSLSDPFTCASNVLHHFQFETIPNQTAGIPFQITITARDITGSLITIWNGVANLSASTGLGTITPTSTTAFTDGRWTGTITLNTPNPSVQIFAEDPSTHKMGMSNTFSVYGALDHFVFDTISSPQTAGQGFTIKIYAKDSLGYTIPNFSDQVNLSVNLGTITPTTTGYFSGGIWIGEVVLTGAGDNVKITAEKNGHTGDSNLFTVLPAPVHTFEFTTIGPQTVDIPFTVTITAKDEFGNVCTNFNGGASLSAVNSTVIEPTSITFTSGVWTGDVKLGEAGTDVQLKVTLATPSVESLSNTFSVAKGLDHFLISTIGNQSKGVPFEITITAQDEDGATFTSFTGTVDITCSLGIGSILPVSLGPFVNGSFTGEITITKPGENVTITVTDPVTGKTGTSNAFNVAGDKLVFKSSPQVINLEEKSQPIIIGIQSPDGNPLVASEDITINLTTTSSTGEFSIDGTTWGVSTLTFSSGSSEAAFYYRDSTPGAWDITVSAESYESATQRITVTGTNANGSGSVTMTPDSALTGDNVNITFTFTATYNLSGGAVKLTVPIGFPNPQITQPQGNGFVSVIPENGVSLGTTNVSANSLLINIQTMPSGKRITIKYQNVPVPNVPNVYTFSFMTMGAGGTFAPIATQPQFTVERGFNLEILSLSVEPLSAGVNASFTLVIRVGTRGALDVSDDINVKFPTGTEIPANIPSSMIKINDAELTTSPIVNQSSSTITIKTPVPIPAETTAKIEISANAGIVNPSSAGTYSIEVTTLKETTPASFSFTLSPPPPIQDVEVQIKPQSAGKEAEYTINFRISMNLLEGDRIYIKFPNGTYLPSVIQPAAVEISGFPIYHEPQVIGRLLVITLSAPLPKGDAYISISKSAGIKNPEIPDKYILYLYTSKDLTEVPSAPYEVVSTPVTVIHVNPPAPDGINGWYVTKPRITFEARGEGEVETYYWWDDETPSLYIGEITAPEGEHILHYYSKSKGIDNAEPVRIKSFKVDSTSPKITILEPQKEYTNKENLIISGITEPGILVACSGSRTTSNSRGQFTLKVKLSQGLNTLKVQAIDSAGNTGEVTIKITLDTAPPYLKLDPELKKWMEVYEPTITIKGEVELGAILTINGQPVNVNPDGTFLYTVTLMEGNNSIHITATDKAGNSTDIYLPIKYIKRTIVKIKIGSRTVYVNDRPHEIEAAPWIDKESGRAMVPLRVIAEAFGATVEYRYVSYGDERVSIIFNMKRIDLRIGSKIAYIDGFPVTLDVAPVIINGRTFVPIRFIMETFGAKVDWDPFTREIIITYPAP